MIIIRCCAIWSTVNQRQQTSVLLLLFSVHQKRQFVILCKRIQTGTCKLDIYSTVSNLSIWRTHNVRYLYCNALVRSLVICDHTVLPATRQRWSSCHVAEYSFIDPGRMKGWIYKWWQTNRRQTSSSLKHPYYYVEQRFSNEIGYRITTFTYR